MPLNIGILKEDQARERRVALTPAGVEALTRAGCPVFVESGAGDGSRFSDEEFQKVGAATVYSRDEALGRADVVLKISTPTMEDCAGLHTGQTILSFLHLGVVKTGVVGGFLAKKITAVGYELIEDERGELPILIAMSEIAGQMTVQIAARLMESTGGGRGIVMGGVTGIPPATVVILGAGNVGRAAARMALGAGAEVIVLDRDLGRLRAVASQNEYRIVTAPVNAYNLRKALRFADVVIGAVLIHGERTPHIVTEEMVKEMKPGAIVIDISIDQGGCFATSRPTTLEDPSFVRHGVVHFCVPNIPAMVARSASHGLTNALLPCLLDLVERGPDAAVAANRGLARGIYTRDGLCTNRAVAKRFELECGAVPSETAGNVHALA